MVKVVEVVKRCPPTRPDWLVVFAGGASVGAVAARARGERDATRLRAELNADGTTAQGREGGQQPHRPGTLPL